MNRLLRKYRSLSPAIKASLWFVVCSALQKAALILTTPIYARLLTQTQFGEYKVFQSWVEVTLILTTLDIFYSGYNVGLEKYREDRKMYTSAMHGLSIALTSFWCLIGMPFAEYMGPLMRISPTQFRLLLVYMYVFPIYQFWSSREKYEYQYKMLVVVTGMTTLLSIAFGTVAAIISENKSDWLIFVRVAVEGVIAIPLLVTSVRGIKSLYNKFYWKNALKFNIPLMPHYLSAMILNHSDVLMIDIICGKAYAGMYSLVYSIAIVITVVQNAVSSAIVPWMYKKLRTQDFKGMRKITTGVIGAMALLNISLILLAPEAVAVMGPPEYAEAVYIVPPIAFGVFLTMIYTLFSHVEFFYHNNRFAATASFIAALSNIVLNYIFLGKFGYMAAGYTTFISYFLLMILHWRGLIRCTRKNDASWRDVFDAKNISLMIGGFAVCAFAIMETYRFNLLRYGLMLSILALIVVNRKRISLFVNQFTHTDERTDETSTVRPK